MGYYTKRYINEILSDVIYKDDILEAMKSSKFYSNLDYALNDDTKSADFEKWMISASKKLKDILIVIDCKGENDNDQYRLYFKNGKMFKSIGTISYETFTEDKLE